MRPAAADARSHQYRAGQDRRLLKYGLFFGVLARFFQAVQHGLKRSLLHNKSAAAAGIVQPAHVPLTEQIIRPFIHGMIEIVRPGIKGQLVELIQGKHGVEKDRRIGAAEDFKRGFHQFAIRSCTYARPANIQWNRPNPLLGVGLDFLFSLQHGHGPIADIVVQPRQCGADNAVDFVPGRPLLQYGLAHPADEKRQK